MHSPIEAMACTALGSPKMLPEQCQIGGAQAILGGPQLMPIGIEDSRRANLVEPLAFIIRELELSRREIVLELGLAAPADDERGDARPAEEPGKRHLRARNPARLGDTDDD